MTPKGPSKAGQLRQAEKTLRGLLRTPKTRVGLIAAVAKGSISRNYVYGWLSERRRDGTITVLKSGATLMFQVAPATVSEAPEPSLYPLWLDPRALPLSTGRTVVVNGVVITKTGENK